MRTHSAPRLARLPSFLDAVLNPPTHGGGTGHSSFSAPFVNLVDQFGWEPKGKDGHCWELACRTLWATPFLCVTIISCVSHLIVIHSCCLKIKRPRCRCGIRPGSNVRPYVRPA